MSYHEGSNWQAKKEDEGKPLYEDSIHGKRFIITEAEIEMIKQTMQSAFDSFIEVAQHEPYSHKEFFECGYIAALRKLNNIVNKQRK